MYIPEISQTIKDQTLKLQTSAFVRRLLVFDQAVIISTTLIMLTILVTEVLKEYFGKAPVFYVCMVITALISYLLAIRQYRAISLTFSDKSTFQKAAIEVLKESGFIVTNNNQRFLAATCAKNRTLISDNFYAVYTKSAVLIFCICELPFPLSQIKSKTVIATIKARCKGGM